MGWLALAVPAHRRHAPTAPRTPTWQTARDASPRVKARGFDRPDQLHQHYGSPPRAARLVLPCSVSRRRFSPRTGTIAPSAPSVRWRTAAFRYPPAAKTSRTKSLLPLSFWLTKPAWTAAARSVEVRGSAENANPLAYTPKRWPSNRAHLGNPTSPHPRALVQPRSARDRDSRRQPSNFGGKPPARAVRGMRDL